MRGPNSRTLRDRLCNCGHRRGAAFGLNLPERAEARLAVRRRQGAPGGGAVDDGERGKLAEPAVGASAGSESALRLGRRRAGRSAERRRTPRRPAFADGSSPATPAPVAQQDARQEPVRTLAKGWIRRAPRRRRDPGQGAMSAGRRGVRPLTPCRRAAPARRNPPLRSGRRRARPRAASRPFHARSGRSSPPRHNRGAGRAR